jgi:hypothetical protein
MVYKVKQKAENNFYNVTLDNLDDESFSFDWGFNDEPNRKLGYSYNWPYDFFSLVELAKVDVAAKKVRGYDKALLLKHPEFAGD